MYNIWILLFISFLEYAISDDVTIHSSRLTKTFHPIHYDLRLIPDIQQQSFSGQVDILFEAPGTAVATGDLSTIELNSYGLNVDDDTITLRDQDTGVNIPLGFHGQYDEHEKFLIKTVDPLVHGKKYILHLNFDGKLFKPKDIGGLILSSYKNENGIESQYIIANFFPVYARRAFPCFDEPYFKATFDFVLAAPDGFSAISNMPAQSVQRGVSAKGEIVIWYLFKRTPLMAPSSFGIFISKLNSVKNTTKNINTWAPTTEIATSLSEQKKWSFIFNSAITVLTFETNFVLPEFNYVFIPDLFRETFSSWGIVYIRANIPIYNLNHGNEDIDSLNLVELRINAAKGVASQYYGDTVSPVWWDEVWLREGISEFEGSFLATRYEGEIEFKKFMPGYIRPAVLDYQSSYGDVLVQKDNELTSSELVKSITRQKSRKGASILFMLMTAFSEEVFRPAVLNFLKQNEFKTGTTKDLIELWQKELHTASTTLPNNLTVEEIVNSWLYNEGLPVVTVLRQQGYGNQTLTISQQKLGKVNSNSPETSSSDNKWYIPITYTTKSQKQFEITKARTWLGPNDASGRTHYTLTLDNEVQHDDWIVFNIKGSGLYRVLYDDYNWNLIAKQLKDNYTIIDELNRAQIVDDVFALASDGRLSYGTALNVGEYLKHETNYYPWFSAYNAFKKLSAAFSHNDIYSDLKEYLKPLIENVYDVVGFYGDEHEEFRHIMLRAETLKWACNLQIGDCVSNAANAMQAILSNNGTKIIHEDYLEAIFCGGIQNADNNTWSQVYDLYRTKRDTYNEKYLLHALACSKNKDIIERYSNLITTNNTLDAEEAQVIFHALTRRPEHTSVALSLLTSNAVTIQKIYGERILSYLILSLGDYLTTQSQYEQVSTLKTLEISQDALVAVNKTLNNIGSSMGWLKSSTPQLQSYFKGEPTGIVESSTATVSTGTVSSGTVSTGTVSSGTVSTGTVSSGTLSTGTVSSGTVVTAQTGSTVSPVTETGNVTGSTSIPQSTPNPKGSSTKAAYSFLIIMISYIVLINF